MWIKGIWRREVYVGDSVESDRARELVERGEPTKRRSS